MDNKEQRERYKEGTAKQQHMGKIPQANLSIIYLVPSVGITHPPMHKPTPPSSHRGVHTVNEKHREENQIPMLTATVRSYS